MKIRFTLLLLLGILYNNAKAYYVTPTIIECIKESEFIFKGKVISIDSSKISIEVLEYAKGKSEQKIKTIEKLWESSCIGGGSFYEYKIGDEYIFYSNESRKEYQPYIMFQDKITADSIELRYCKEISKDSTQYIDYKISSSTYLMAIKDFDNTFINSTRKALKEENFSQKNVHIFIRTNQLVYDNYKSTSLFHKEISEEADKYIEES
jgi:hypothetical protein